MNRVIVGMDVGGTKTMIIVESLEGAARTECEVSSTGWDAEPIDTGVRWITKRLRDVVPDGAAVASLVIGAQGLDAPEISRGFAEELARAGFPAIAVNDAALVVPSAGLERGIGVISGTGSIAVATAADGSPMFAGGWGWVIGDEGGAAALVREATKAALLARDSGSTDDGLLGALCLAFDVTGAERLARAVNDDPTMHNWGSRAPAVFAAADAGSRLAADVIGDAALHLAVLVDQLVGRGAVGDDVVAAGSVITRQPRLFEAFRRQVEAQHPGLRVLLSAEPPVTGALELARRAVSE